MYKSIDVANKFLQLAYKDGQSLKAMKLLKLVYIAHGYYLGFNKKPLIKDEIQAWKYGPVIPELYDEIKYFKGNPLPYGLFSFNDSELKSEDDKFIEVVWKHYKNYTGIQLSDKTHEKGTPWDEAYNYEIRYTTIENERIQAYYDEKLKPLQEKVKTSNA